MDKTITRRRKAPEVIAKGFLPRDLDPATRKVWMSVATHLADANRLKPEFCDLIAEYARLVIRMRAIREYLGPSIEGATYETETRAGRQVKLNPWVSQLNECCRQWRALIDALGMSPRAAERLAAEAPFDEFEDDPAREFYPDP